jgi:hypothetical protein
MNTHETQVATPERRLGDADRDEADFPAPDYHICRPMSGVKPVSGPREALQEEAGLYTRRRRATAGFPIAPVRRQPGFWTDGLGHLSYAIVTAEDLGCSSVKDDR